MEKYRFGKRCQDWTFFSKMKKKGANNFSHFSGFLNYFEAFRILALFGFANFWHDVVRHHCHFSTNVAEWHCWPQAVMTPMYD